MKTITVVEVNDITLYPPVQNLVKVLLHLNFKVNLLGCNLNNISDDIKANPNCNLVELGKVESVMPISRRIKRLKLYMDVRKKVKLYMRDSDYLWTTSFATIVALWDDVLKYRNIFQLMELTGEYGVILRGKVKLPLGEIARNSWRTVVPEINRAYIQKAWWDLERLPYILPNKPYSIDYGILTPELEIAIDKMKKERRKIVLYLGVLYSDREFETYAKAILQMKDYAFYIAGKALSGDSSQLVNKLIDQYDAVYLGFFTPPKHLALIQNAYIGLLPYKTVKANNCSILNALYCAPNKIYEYSGFGVPMVGSDVLGLKLPFAQWNIGRCCDFNDENSIIKAINEVDKKHDKMSENCYKFYNSVDLEKVVLEILAE